ncbi:CMP/dCMP deaminase zinc-binding [Gloeothece citriformis PCC 7424]|uniref:CMP/dCMP deaminase zinc-binding n=1 Tax=Gloeothece citriformis (strain PCC 7424) TaxID=65393 RepID=B7KGT6_GLOC7|nr:nucleoside deaminase [Gloeothece citriformis]ACK73423.1 CMP/dCMP deaminase zinc-binding [Gloeothece citriformis PCC 7424]
MSNINDQFMAEAIALSFEGMRLGEGGPFGAVIVKEGKIIAKGYNQVISSNDPTAHAEVVAIRHACQVLQNFDLKGCELYTSCEPCPMCLGAIYWARLDKIYYGNSKIDAAKIGFDDNFIYQELERSIDKRQLPMMQIMSEEAFKAFQEWADKQDKIPY